MSQINTWLAIRMRVIGSILLFIMILSLPNALKRHRRSTQQQQQQQQYLLSCLTTRFLCNFTLTVLLEEFQCQYDAAAAAAAAAATA